MMPETLLHELLKEWAEEAEVPRGLAERALRGRPRHRVRVTGLAAGLTAAVVIAGVAVPWLLMDDDPAPAPVLGGSTAVPGTPVPPGGPSENGADPEVAEGGRRS